MVLDCCVLVDLAVGWFCLVLCCRWFIAGLRLLFWVWAVCVGLCIGGGLPTIVNSVGNVISFYFVVSCFLKMLYVACLWFGCWFLVVYCLWHSGYAVGRAVLAVVGILGLGLDFSVWVRYVALLPGCALICWLGC